MLDAIREELRKHDYIPVLFDFDKPASKDITGTVETLARMARFIVADLTDPSSIPHELATIVPFLRTTPVLPTKVRGSEGYAYGSSHSATNTARPEFHSGVEQISNRFDGCTCHRIVHPVCLRKLPDKMVFFSWCPRGVQSRRKMRITTRSLQRAVELRLKLARH